MIKKQKKISAEKVDSLSKSQTQSAQSEHKTDIRLDSKATRKLLRWLNCFSVFKWQFPATLGLVFQTLSYIGFAGCTASAIALYANPKDILPSQSSLLLPLLIAGIPLFACLRALSLFLASFAGNRLSIQARSTLRKQAITQLLQAGPLYTERHDTGKISTDIIEIIESLKGYYTHYHPLVFSILPSTLLLLIAAFFASYIGALIFLVTLPLLPLFMGLIGLATQDASRNQIKTLGRLAGFFQDRLSSLDTLKSFGASQKEGETLTKAAELFREKTMHVLRLAFLSSAALEFFSALAIALSAVYIGFSLLGIFPFNTGETPTLASGLFILILAPEAYAPFRRLAAAYHDRANAVIAGEKLYNFLSEESEVLKLENQQNQKFFPAAKSVEGQLPPEIIFSNVSVIYPDKRKALEQISLKFPANQITHLKGPSGSGKSTILKLLMGFAPLTEGDILVNGQKAENINSLLSTVAWCGQKTRLFQDSIFENLRFAAPESSQAMLEEACQKAGILSFIHQLPEKFATVIGTNGFGLSGGQAQRIALARTFLKPSSLWLFDEPTAYIDSETEKEILTAIKIHAKGKTVVLASHSQTLPSDFAQQQIDLGCLPTFNKEQRS